MNNAPRPGIIERAFQLARSGEFGTISDVGKRLRQEGYERVDLHLAGGSLRAQLRQMLVVTEQPADA